MYISDFIALLFFLTLLIGGIFGAYYLQKASCMAKTISFKESKFDPISGCMVLHNGRWLPLENIRGFDDKG